MYCSASNIIYGTTELCLPFLFDLLKNQVNKMVFQYENNTYDKFTTFLFLLEGGKAVIHLRHLLLAPDLPHHQHEPALHVDCVPEVGSKHDRFGWSTPKHIPYFLLQVNVDQECRVNHRGGKV